MSSPIIRISLQLSLCMVNSFWQDIIALTPWLERLTLFDKIYKWVIVSFARAYVI